MLKVHHLNHSRSHRVLWMLEELGQPYELVLYERNKKTMLAPPSLKAVHPLGKSPVITDGAQTLAESAAILEYLVEKYGEGRFAPAPGTPEHLSYRYWMHYAEGSAMPPLLLKLIFDRVESSPMPFFVKPIAKKISSQVKGLFILPNIETHLDFQEASLAEHPWFGGPEFSAADIQMSYAVEAARSRGGLNETRPRLMAFLAAIQSRPAYQRASARGGA